MFKYILYNLKRYSHSSKFTALSSILTTVFLNLSFFPVLLFFLKYGYCYESYSMTFDAFGSVSTVKSKRHAEIIIGDYLRQKTGINSSTSSPIQNSSTWSSTFSSTRLQKQILNSLCWLFSASCARMPRDNIFRYKDDGWAGSRPLVTHYFYWEKWFYFDFTNRKAI